LTVTGSKTPVIAGDFEAGLVVTGVGQPANKAVLGTVSVAGMVRDATWTVTGSIGTMTVGKLLNVNLEMTGVLFKSLTVKAAAGFTDPVFINSNIEVNGTLLSAKLGKVQTDNSGAGGVDFGVSAGALGPVEYVNLAGTKVTVKSPTNPPPETDGDFFVVFLI
jgi:hypothetical protein